MAKWGTNGSSRALKGAKGAPGGTQCSPKDDSCTVSRLPRLPKTTVAQFARSQRVPKGLQVGHNAPKDDCCTVSKVYKGQLEQL